MNTPRERRWLWLCLRNTLGDDMLATVSVLDFELFADADERHGSDSDSVRARLTIIEIGREWDFEFLHVFARGLSFSGRYPEKAMRPRSLHTPSCPNLPARDSGLTALGHVQTRSFHTSVATVIH